MPPRVSAIIIVYNGEPFLEEAIASVEGQTFTDWELLIVDDGSTDASVAIARDHAELRSGQIRLIAHPDRCNHGMSATRNLGLAHARGDYVAFLDADDVWLPDKLDEQVRIMDQTPAAGLVYGRTLIWHGWAAGDAGRPADFYYDLGVAADHLYPPPILFELLLQNQSQTPTTCNALMRRDLVEAVGGFEESFKGMFEDQIFFAKALLHAPAYVSGQTWAKYRQHPASCSAISAARGHDARARLQFLHWMARYLRDEAGAGLGLQQAVWRRILEARWHLVKGYCRHILKG